MCEPEGLLYGERISHTFPWKNFSRMNYLKVCLVLLNLLWYLSRVFIFVLVFIFFSRFLVHINWMVVNSYHSLSGSLRGVGSHRSIIIEEVEGVAYPLLMSSKVFRVGGCCWKHPYCVCRVSSVKLHEVRLMTKGLVTEKAHVWIHIHRQCLSGLHSTMPEGTSTLIMSPQVRTSTEGPTGFLSCAGFPCVV